MTSFLHILTHRYKQLLIDFGYDKIEVGTFVIAGNECESTKEVLEETGATVKVCNGDDPIEEVMEIIDEAELPHCFLINLNPLEHNPKLSVGRVQEIFGVVNNKMMRTHLYLFNTRRAQFIGEMDTIKKSINSFGRQYQMSFESYENKDKYKYTSSFGEKSIFWMIYPPE